MVSWSGGLPVSGWGGPGYPQQPAGRPLLVTGAAITGIAVGVLELLPDADEPLPPPPIEPTPDDPGGDPGGVPEPA